MLAKYSIDYIDADTSVTYNPQEIKKMIVVDQGDFEVGQLPMMSEGFYNCVAIIGLAKKAGLFGHFQRISTPEVGNYNRFGDALRALAEIEPHTIILAGSYIFENPVDLELATHDRAFAENAVRNTFPDLDLVVKWNEHHKGRQDIIVYPDSARVAIHNATSNFAL